MMAAIELAKELQKAESENARLEARCGELEVIMQEVVDADDEANRELEAMGMPRGAARLTEKMRQALSGNGSRVADVLAFQDRVGDWMLECFGPEISADTVERNHRFLEEALELVQANDCTASEAHQLVDYVYGRATGEPHQECGGVMVTLAALCRAAGLDMTKAGEDELARIWTKVETIRAKQAAKPNHSPLPGALDAGESDDG